MHKKELFNFVRIPLLASLISLITVLPAFASDGYIGDDVGTDLYSRVDAGIGTITKSLATKRITGSSERIQAAIEKSCQIKKKILAGRDFSYEELGQISRGDIRPLTNELNATQGGLDTHKLESTAVDCIAKATKKEFDTIKSEAGYERNTLSTLSKVGLYTDGSVDNSSFDLMYDLDKIHSILFAKDLPYNGTPNDSGGEIARYLASGPRLPNSAPAPTGTTPPGSGAPSLTGSTNTGTGTNPGTLTGATEQTNNTPYCPPGETIGGLDDALKNDIANQTQNGGNGGSSVGGIYEGTTTRNVGNWAGSKYANGAGTKRPIGGTSFGKFGCKDFFCIDVDFISYSQGLLTGGRSYSIQSLLEMNMKVVNQFAGSSFIQAKHTNNFFELLLKNLNLPSMSHIGVVVTSLPAPILNLPGKDTPRGNPPESENEKEFIEIENGVLMDYGFNVKRVNELQTIASNPKDYAISTHSSLTTEFTPSKFTPFDTYRTRYFETKSNAIQNEYGGGFGQDLVQFEAFTKAFVDHIGNFISLIEKIDEIPQG